MADEEKLEREDSEQEVEGQSQQMGEALQPEQTEKPRTGEDDSGDGTNEMLI
jgi:hypothetical protein